MNPFVSNEKILYSNEKVETIDLRLSWSLNFKGLFLRGFSAFAQSTLVFFISKENASGNVRRLSFESYIELTFGLKP